LPRQEASISTPSEDNDLVLTAELDDTHDCCYLSSASLTPQAPATVKLTLDWKQQRGDKRRNHLVSGVVQRAENLFLVYIAALLFPSLALYSSRLVLPHTTRKGYMMLEWWVQSYTENDHRPSRSAGTAVKKRW